MTNAQHTPGPLHPSEDEGSGALFIYSPKAVSIVARVSSAVITERNRADARLLAAACTSYDKHFGPNAIAAAEADLLGEALAALQSVGEWCDLIEQNYPEMLFTKRVRALLTKAGKDGQ